MPVSVAEVIDFLNVVNNADPTVLPALINHRVPCNEMLMMHPTVQVGYVDENEPSKGWEVGLLGILNGIFGVDDKDWGFIYAEFRPDGSIRRFRAQNEEEVEIKLGDH